MTSARPEIAPVFPIRPDLDVVRPPEPEPEPEIITVRVIIPEVAVVGDSLPSQSGDSMIREGEISSEDVARARDRGSREVFFRPFSSADNVGVVGVPLLAVERSLAEGQHSIVFELVRSGKGGKFETRQVQVE